MDLTAARREVPVAGSWNYLNHAAVAPLCRPAAQAMRNLVADVEANGMVHHDTWRRLYLEARQSVATLLNAQPSDIAFLKNTTDGIIAAANGVRWQPGDNVLVADHEFPANVYPWLNLQRRGVEVRWIREQQGRLAVDDFAAAADRRTRVVAVSSVEFLSGFRNDLARLGEVCRQHHALFVVDAIQSLGAFPLDVASVGIDVLAADGHKWLLAPEGCALFYISPEALSQLEVSALGWSGVAGAYDFCTYDTTLHPDARRFETGTQNTVGIAGLKAAVDFLLAQGIPAIEERILQLTDRLCQGLEERGFRLLSSRRTGEKSGIVTFAHPGRAAEEVLEALRREQVIGSLRGGHLRLSPHFYNTEDEIDQALQVLSAT